MAFHGRYNIFLIVLAISTYVLSISTCGKLKTIGYTVPQGDIILRYGEPLDITCTLYENVIDKYGMNASSNLYFARNNETLPKEMIEVISPTSIRLHISEPPKVKGDNYYCLFKKENKPDEITCMNVVVVGVPPQNVTDFSCIGRNYDNLTCTWTPPENYVRTDYNLSFYLKRRASRFHYSCPKLKLENGKMSCFWNISTNPQYRQSHSVFYFRVGMNNTFGSKNAEFTFDHFKHVLPNPPWNFVAVATSPHSIHLSWKVPSSMVSFPSGLHHRILYQCEYYEKKWQFGALITEHTKNENLEYELKDLKYAHALCDIRVSMRSAVADEDDESMWSDNATKTERTKSKIPDKPPETNVGSFEVVNNGFYRDAYVYWKQIKEEQKNGQNFTYEVEVTNHHFMRPAELTKAYAKFENLSAINYTVNIWSKNEEGRSSTKSSVSIPYKREYEPLNFIKVAPRENFFELSWDPPKAKGIALSNYTIFWCSNERDRPYQCEGNLNWKVVSKDTFHYNQTLPKKRITYQFAISANSPFSSSGMSWAECTVIPNRNMGKMKYVWINRVGSDFIEIGWKLDCFDRIGSVKGFIICYCPIVSPVQTQCKEPMKNVTIDGDISLQAGKVTKLKPYTIYHLTVAFIINNSTYSQFSEPLYNTTNEAAPTPPSNVNVINKTNSSITLNWLTPAETNGVLKFYRVYYNNNNPITVNPDKNEITLTGLMSFENYTIYITACTVACSERSETINVTTKMWSPGKIRQPTVVHQNDSVIAIEWDRPTPARGNIDYYEVQFTQKLNFENKTMEPYKTYKNHYDVKDCGDSGKYNTFFVSVRAVNVIEGESKMGPWSDVLESYCTQSTSWIYILVGVVVFFGVIFMFVVFKRIYSYCKEMKDVQVKLPPGLTTVVELGPRLPEKHPKDIDRSSRADEELLLDKFSEIPLSGASSGCSSGHESITSSLESTTHMSTSDSGTEQPRSPSLDERKNSLRQRNVPASRPTISKGYVTPDAVPTANWPTKPSPASTGNYCVLGVDPSNQPETDPPYVPITELNTKIPLPYISCDLASQPPPYVLTGDFVKTPNPGYVPYTSEPANKNSGYVVAGLTKDLLVPDLLQCDTYVKPMNVEEKPLYVKAAENLTNLKGVQFPWQQPPLDSSVPKSGYVSVGDAPPPKTITEVTKGYVPHRQFETKSLKED